ncbi:MAG: DUF4360 domain-containing protein [Pseudobacteriovorax sp.]|nr:DUF4360 domain-containing protein [Pseudobacteriovorax sp.]
MKLNVKKGFLAVSGLLLSSSLFASVPSSEISIVDINHNGSGCPLGTVAENVSDDKQAFTVTFSDYIAEAGPGLTPRDGRKNCQLTLTLNVPQGWQFSIASFDYRGFAFLDRGVKADYRTSYYFQGDRATETVTRTAWGYYDDNFQFREELGLASAVWSPCGAERALNINTAISVRNTNKRRNPDAEGVIGTDSIDGQIQQIWGISWRRCR